MHALRRHIDLLRKGPIKKGIINIKLVSSPLPIESNAKHSTDGDGIDHGTESLMKVNAQLLVKIFSNKPSFILCNRAIRILFNAKHPFVAHYILPWAQGNQSPSTIPDESIIFFLHYLTHSGSWRAWVKMQGLVR